MPVVKYIYDGDTVLQETDGAGTTLTEYTSTPDGDLLSEFDGSATKYYEPDGLGSTDALTDSTQAVTDRWAYRAFGAAIHTTGSDPTPFTWVGRQGYVGDSQTGLYLLGARYYDPSTAQFLSADPIGFAGGDANLYRYVENQPTLTTDSTGLAPSQKQLKAARDARRAHADYAYNSILLQCPWEPETKRLPEKVRKLHCEEKARRKWLEIMAEPLTVDDTAVEYKDCLVCNRLKMQMEDKIKKRAAKAKLDDAEATCVLWAVVTATYACVIACELNEVPKCDVKGGQEAFKKQLDLGREKCESKDWFSVDLET